MRTFLLLLLIGSDNPYDSGPPSSPDESLAQIRVPENVVVELVAAEPLVVDPVAMEFDEQGRLFVAEYRDYPTGPADPDAPPLSRIRRLLDKDGDGRMDEAEIFADQLPSAQGLACWRGGLIVTGANTIWWLSDHDGDGKADEKKVLFEGLGRHNTQLQPAHPRLGLDNWFYVTNGLAGGKIHRPGEQEPIVDISGTDFCFNPLGDDFEPATGLGQFGNTFDAVGNRFTSSNRNPIIHEVMPYRALRRNPYAVMPSGYYDAAPSGALSRVYPIVETSTTAYSHTGTHTAACGVHVHQGDLLGEDLNGHVFVCDPTGHLVTCSRLIPDGVTFRSNRILQTKPIKSDWLVSSDRWFRPVSLANGPDGSLYVCDMYRAVIEHPVYMPPGVAEKVPNLRAGDDKGRIYRIRAKGAISRKYEVPTAVPQQVSMLSDVNGWRRMTARRLLVEKSPNEALPLLSDLLSNSDNSMSRLYALTVLDGMKSIDEDHLVLALQDVDPQVREQGLIICSRLTTQSPALRSVILRQWKSNRPRVQFRAILAIQEAETSEEIDAIAERMRIDGQSFWIWTAMKSVMKDCADQVLDRILSRPETLSSFNTVLANRASELAELVAARGDEKEFRYLLEDIASISEESNFWSFSLLRGLANGMPRHTAGRIPPNLAAMIEKPPKEWEKESKSIAPVVTSAVEIANDERATLIDRFAAIQFLAYLSGPEVVSSLINCLDRDQPIEIQYAANDVIRLRGDEKLLLELISRWDRLTTQTKQTTIPLLLQRGSTILALLDAIDAKKIPAGTIGVDQRAILLASGNAAIKSRAESLFGGAVSSDRQAMMEQYKVALTMPGDVERGRQVYRRACSNCHRVFGEGKLVGPDIGDVRNKTPEQLLGDIIDPNRIVEPRYASCTVLLNDGRSMTGRVLREMPESVVLLQAGAVETVVPRAEIDTIVSNGMSLMTVGIEKDVSVQEMADLINFLKAGR